MYRLFFTPEWFNGWDIVVDAVGLIVALLIAAYSWRIYKINQENRFAYFSLAFLLVTFGFLVKIFASSILYFVPVRDVIADVLKPAVGPRLQFSYLYYRAAFFLEMASFLGAWLLIYFTSQKPRQRLHKYDELTQIALFVYLVLLISVIANFKYFVFYLTSAVLLSLIVLNYYKNYLNTNHNKKAFLVMLSFFFVLLGNLFFVFVTVYQPFYVLGEILQLIGFLVLLYTYRRIISKQ